MSEITHPYWHLIERDVEVDFASPKGGKIGWSPYSDPYGQGTTEPHDLVSKGFLSDAGLKARLETTLALSDVDPALYDAVHVAGGRARLSISIRTRTSRKYWNISGPAKKLWLRSATAPSRSATLPNRFAAVA